MEGLGASAVHSAGDGVVVVAPDSNPAAAREKIKTGSGVRPVVDGIAQEKRGVDRGLSFQNGLKSGQVSMNVR